MHILEPKTIGTCGPAVRGCCLINLPSTKAEESVVVFGSETVQEDRFGLEKVPTPWYRDGVFTYAATSSLDDLDWRQDSCDVVSKDL